ncbi:hypothetical protein ACFHWD_00245 [Clostridium sp. MT-14]|jgi:uncharacterized membrane protein|uniref:Uncharacterized protein n=1 Tax=Clostridium aromativorans TaxID=2836848 RepID=A0ABS8N0I6_9CLOT|nr:MULTISPECIES: hypothetical protein [Clostridium]MCC9293301.1 hypothetical protein [Clostridium aromativorans]CAB1251895.1 conserved hypothetical protein [Clostridiaceae bacterium BL-3]
MIADSVSGAVLISIIDMILLLFFLYVIGLILRLLPMVNKIHLKSHGREKHDNT